MTNVTNISATSGALTAQAPILPAAVQSQNITTPSRQVADPLSGVVITQFLNPSGLVASQVPSRAVVAYLQNGLTPDGFAKSGSGQITTV
jgi:hypothetical protein